MENPRDKLPIKRTEKSPEERDFSASLEVNHIKPIKLIRMDSSQAYFLDSGGKPWYFNFEDRVWREARPMDFHPVATQMTRVLGAQEKNFDSVEEAMIYATLLRLEEDIATFKLLMVTSTEEVKILSGDLIVKMEKMKELLDSIKEESDENKKSEMKKEYEEIAKQVYGKEADEPSET